MGEKVTETMEKVVYSGREVWYSDYRGLVGDEFVMRIRENGEAAESLGMKGTKDRLTLADVRGCFATQEILEAFKEVATKSKPFNKASAIVGLTGLQKHLLEIVNKVSGLGARPFDTPEEALDWLVKQADK